MCLLLEIISLKSSAEKKMLREGNALIEADPISLDWSVNSTTGALGLAFLSHLP